MERGGGGGGGYTRWTMLGLAVFSYQGLSFCDNFGIFSSEVKSQFELTQDQLNSIATAGFWPNLLGAAIVPGLVNDRFGAPVTMVGAGVFTSAGLGGFWLTVTGRLPVLMGSPHTQLMLLQGLTSWGLQWPSAAVMPANMKAFPAHMEPVNSVCVVALLKCVSSVGGCLSVQLYLAFLAPDQTAYILFLAVSALVIFVPGAALLKTFPAPTTLDDDFRRFVPTFAVVIVVVSASIWNAHMAAGLSRAVRGAFAAALLGAFSLIGLTLVYDTRSFLGRSRGQARADATTPLLLSGQAEPLKSVAPHRSAAAAPQQQQLQQGFTVQDDPRLSATALPVQQQHVEAEEAHTGSSPAVYGELTVWRTMATIDCWLMVLCTFATMASVNVFTVNIAQICEAIGVASATPFVMTLYSAGSAVGRLGSTLIAEALRRHGHPRSYSFMFMCVDMLVAQLVLATSSYPGLLIGALLTGLCNGGIWMLLPLIMADLFGLENLGANYKIACFGEAVGAIVFGRVVAAQLYENAIEATQRTPAAGSSGGAASADSTSTACFGADCFRWTFLLCALLCCAASAAGLLLGQRTGRKQRLRDEGERFSTP